MISSPFLAGAPPGLTASLKLDEGKGVMGMVEKGMDEKVFQLPANTYGVGRRPKRAWSMLLVRGEGD
jgi:hypothetical protein